MKGKAGPNFYDLQLRLLLFGGKGGVGKTTCATATAMQLARYYPKESFLLVSTDPAHSLADCLADSHPPDNLKILELDAQECLVAFKKNHEEKFRELASRGTFFDDEDINRLLDLSLPGLDEIMAFFEISGWIEEERYKCIVVDTAPTGHTLRLLGMPELIQKWLGAMDALLAKHRYMKKLFKGTYQPDELDAFLLDLSGSTQRMETLLRDHARCRFVPVMIAERLSIRETETLLKELHRAKIHVIDIVINGLFPDSTCKVCSDKHNRQLLELQQFFEQFTEYSLWGVPMYPEEVRGLEPLTMFWEDAVAFDSIPSPPQEHFFRGPRVEFPVNPPLPDVKFLLFAGKGGVGKTTMACATAVKLARDFRDDMKILLFSTDPAHSLSVCLDVQIGSKPTRIAAGLMAMEINAQAEFDTLKKQYAEELEGFLGNISHNLDLTFDRDVMERVMDLSPPGLDEVMALTLAMEFLAQDKYDVFIFDTAPTGHLIRLLETPELIDQWLKLFFDLFLKYKRVFRLPNIAKRLIIMSKELKRLRSLLRDHDRSILYAVTILTEMAFEETNDLVAACEQRLGIHVPVLFLNLATPVSKCPLCLSLYNRESQVRKKYQQAYPKKHQTLVYRQSEPRGLDRLEELGKALFLPVLKVGGVG